MIDCSMLGWQEYNATLAPISRDPHLAGSRGGRPVVNFLGGGIQLPSALDTPRYDRPELGPVANR